MTPATEGDVLIGAGAVLSPWWLPWLHQAGTEFLFYGGIALLVIRLAVSLREWFRGRRVDKTETEGK